MTVCHDSQVRLLIVNRDFNVGGGVTYIKHLGQALSDHGWTIEIMAQKGEMADEMPAGCKLRPTPVFSMLQLPFLVRRLRRGGYSVANCHAYTPAPVLSVACAAAKMPLIVTLHGPGGEKRHAQWARIFHRSAAVVALNESIAHHYHSAGLPWEKLFVSRLLMPFRETVPQKPEGTLRLAYCSRLSKSKGVMAELFIRAAATLGPDSVEIIGDGPLKKQLEELAQKLKVPANFSGNSHEVSSRLARAHIGVGAGYVAVEALEAGCATVGIGFDGCIGAVTPANFDDAVGRNFGDHAGRFLKSTVEDVAFSLQQAISSLRSREVHAVRDRAKQEFGLDKVGPTLAEFYRRVCLGQSFEGLGIDAKRFVV